MPGVESWRGSLNVIPFLDKHDETNELCAHRRPMDGMVGQGSGPADEETKPHSHSTP